MDFGNLLVELRPYPADLLLQVEESGVHLAAHIVARLHNAACEALLNHGDQIFSLLAVDLAQQFHQRLAARVAQLLS